MDGFIKENGTGLHEPCEICEVKNATEIKGGINFLTNKRGLWYCCKDCVQKIEDERKKGRKHNGS